MFEKPQEGTVSYDSGGKMSEENKEVGEELKKREVVQNKRSEVESDELKIEQVRKSLRDSASEKVSPPQEEAENDKREVERFNRGMEEIQRNPEKFLESLEGTEKNFAEFLREGEIKLNMLFNKDLMHALGPDKWRNLMRKHYDEYKNTYQDFKLKIPGNERTSLIQNALVEQRKISGKVSPRINPVDVFGKDFRMDAGQKNPEESSVRKAEKLTLENIKRAVQNGKPLRVKVLRSSGTIEDDWMAMGVNSESGNAVVMKFVNPQDKGINKEVRIEDLQKWNS